MRFTGLQAMHARTGVDLPQEALRVADRVVELHGPLGKRFWIYSLRDGSIVEPYPWYSVHHDAMAFMALAAAESRPSRVRAAARGRTFLALRVQRAEDAGSRPRAARQLALHPASRSRCGWGLGHLVVATAGPCFSAHGARNTTEPRRRERRAQRFSRRSGRTISGGCTRGR
jgi:hypothetical protein